MDNYKPILKSFESIKDKFASANKKQKNLIKILVVTSIALFISILCSIFIFSNPTEYKAQQSTEVEQIEIIEKQIDEKVVLPEEEAGRGGPLDFLNPFSGFQESVVNAFSEIITQGLELFDDYVAFTPNVAKSDGNIKDARGNDIPIHVNKFYNASQTVAWLLLPLFIVVIGVSIVLEGNIRGIQLLQETGKKVLLLIVGFVAFRFFFATFIDLNNSLNHFVLSNLVGGSGNTMSESLMSAFSLQMADGHLEFSIKGALNIFGEIILWVGLFFMLATLLFQFIIRFFHLLLHLILFPIVSMLSLLPGGGQLFKSYLEDLLRTIFMQPIFLIGIGIALEIIKSVNEPVPKVILGLGSLAFLNIIPALVNRFSGIMWGVSGSVAGGLLTMATVGSARKIKDGISGGMNSGQNNSGRNFAGRAIGDVIMSKLPFGSSTKSALKTGSEVAGKGSSSVGLVSGAASKGASTLSKVGMKPLSKESLTPKSASGTLFSTKPDFSAIGNVSLRDSERLSSAYMQTNYDEVLGHPMTSKPSSLDQITDLSSFHPVNDQTESLMNQSIDPKPSKVRMGKTFDTSNTEHWNHLSSWYSNNESLATNKPVESFTGFTSNPANRMSIIKQAGKEGYFQSQGIKTVKVTDQMPNKEPIDKFYQLKSNNRRKR